MLIVNCIGKLGGAPNALGSKNPPAYYASPIWITRKGISQGGIIANTAIMDSFTVLPSTHTALTIPD